MSNLSFREKLHRWVDLAEGIPGRIIGFLIIFLVLISIVSLPLELLSFFKDYSKQLFIVESVVVGIFTLEYLVRIYAAPNRKQYIFSWAGFIDLASILPFYIAFIDTRILRLFRLARLARVFKVANLQAVKHHAEELQLFADEKIEHFAQKHPFIFYINVVPVLFWVSVGLFIYAAFPSLLSLQICIAFLTLAFAQFVYAWIHYSHDIIYLTNYRIIITHRELFQRQSHELYYKDIIDIRTFHPHFLAYLVGFGSIVIETSAGTRSFAMEKVANHENVSHYIDTKKREMSSH